MQQRKIQLEDIFQYELYAVPSSIIDEYGTLPKGNKSVFACRIGVADVNAETIDISLIDAMQLLYYIT